MYVCCVLYNQVYVNIPSNPLRQTKEWYLHHTKTNEKLSAMLLPMSLLALFHTLDKRICQMTNCKCNRTNRKAPTISYL